MGEWQPYEECEAFLRTLQAEQRQAVLEEKLGRLRQMSQAARDDQAESERLKLTGLAETAARERAYSTPVSRHIPYIAAAV